MSSAHVKERARSREYDAVVVGAGPNGLSAAIVLAQAGCSVLLVEAAAQVGGGVRSGELTLPGFISDICSAAYPLGKGSPFFRTLPLADHGLVWVDPPVALAHPLDDGTAVLLHRSLPATADNLGPDAGAYQALMAPLLRDFDVLVEGSLGPLRLPSHPIAMARFGWHAFRSARGLAEEHFAGDRARALFAGVAAHAMLPLEDLSTAAIGLLLSLAGHAVGWPVVRGGAQHLSDALASYLRSLGGEILTGARIASVDELPAARAVLLDLSPRQVLRLAGHRLSAGYRARLSAFRYGFGSFKLDYALDGPIPWRAPECARAGTLHLSGTLPEIAASEQQVARGEHPERPYVLVIQPSLFDPTRAPPGKHTAWAYCHVPNGSTVDMTGAIEGQIERFAPGFRDLVLARHVKSPARLEAYNENYIGGDINGGASDLRQLFSRPTSFYDPYATSDPGLFICSASAPPGGGVHGRCGTFAALRALARLGVRDRASNRILP